MSAQPVLEVTDLTKRFAIGAGRQVYAVNGVSFSIGAGESVGLVGESGSGKSTIGLLVTRLLPATSGRIVFAGTELASLGEPALRRLRASLQIVFQNPWGALNPRMTIARLLDEPLKLHTTLDPQARRSKVRALADRVHLPLASLERYPHELSGGQLQRVGIARAIATRPKLVVLDEPTSSLDLSVRAGVLKLLDEIRRESGVSMLFISHDLETVELVTDRVLVLYLGQIVESARTQALFRTPEHPYTQALFSAALKPDPRAATHRHVLQGEIPKPTALPHGCGFASRCPIAIPACGQGEIAHVAVSDTHTARCVRIAAGENRLALAAHPP